jgi:hypothetical protein
MDDGVVTEEDLGGGFLFREEEGAVGMEVSRALPFRRRCKAELSAILLMAVSLTTLAHCSCAAPDRFSQPSRLAHRLPNPLPLSPVTHRRPDST